MTFSTFLLGTLVLATPVMADEIPSEGLLPNQGKDCRPRGWQHDRHLQCEGNQAEAWVCGAGRRVLVLGQMTSDVATECSSTMAKICALEIGEGDSASFPDFAANPCAAVYLKCNEKNLGTAAALDACAMAQPAWKKNRCGTCQELKPGGHREEQASSESAESGAASELGTVNAAEVRVNTVETKR